MTERTVPASGLPLAGKVSPDVLVALLQGPADMNQPPPHVGVRLPRASVAR